MATYKHAQYLPTALRGVADQKYKKIELIIVSVEGDIPTERVLKKAQDEGFPFKWIISKKATSNVFHDKGLGLKACKGDWIIFSDSDDFLLPDAIKNHLALAKRHDALVVCSTYYLYDENLTPLRKANHLQRYDYKKLVTGRNYIPDCSLVSRQCYDEFGWEFDRSFREGGVFWNRWLKIGEKYPDRFAFNLIPAFLHRQHSAQISRRRSWSIDLPLSLRVTRNMAKLKIASLRRVMKKSCKPWMLSYLIKMYLLDFLLKVATRLSAQFVLTAIRMLKRVRRR
jgi:glycosyltransferase involved in cell wall biosynthesis